MGGSSTFSRPPTRKFSFLFVRSPKFRIKFSRHVDLRFALLLPRYLNLPLGVERALRDQRCRHVVSENRRCAAFALGAARVEGRSLMWYIFTLQSDLAFSKRAVLRGYIRGWRKVLFASIINCAASNSVTALYLSPSKEIIRPAFRRHPPAANRIPPVWEFIYDKTAQEFGMSKITVADPVNIEVLPRRRPCLSNEFFRLILADMISTGEDS